MHGHKKVTPLQKLDLKQKKIFCDDVKPEMQKR